VLPGTCSAVQDMISMTGLYPPAYRIRQTPHHEAGIEAQAGGLDYPE
jgi:hypothetical protein